MFLFVWLYFQWKFRTDSPIVGANVCCLNNNEYNNIKRIRTEKLNKYFGHNFTGKILKSMNFLNDRKFLQKFRRTVFFSFPRYLSLPPPPSHCLHANAAVYVCICIHFVCVYGWWVFIWAHDEQIKTTLNFERMERALLEYSSLICCYYRNRYRYHISIN